MGWQLLPCFLSGARRRKNGVAKNEGLRRVAHRRLLTTPLTATPARRWTNPLRSLIEGVGRQEVLRQWSRAALARQLSAASVLALLLTEERSVDFWRSFGSTGDGRVRTSFVRTRDDRTARVSQASHLQAKPVSQAPKSTQSINETEVRRRRNGHSQVPNSSPLSSCNLRVLAWPY